MEEPKTLPQEIILLLCQELATRCDFGTLFNCALVSRRVASIACEQMYSIHEQSSASMSITPSDRCELWKSIILSSVEQTAFPYCTYLRTLSLGNLEECLYHERRFFIDNLQQFVVQATARPSLDIQATVIKCADSIMAYIRKFADDTEKAVALAHLEGLYIPYDILPTWITRLSLLTSLRIQDGSVLGVEAAKAISECCPNFTDLTCYYYQSSSADEDLGAFFRTLRSNTLRSFSVNSSNGIGKNALMGLNSHATSLRNLELGSLGIQAMKALYSLADCTALETLKIENDRFSRVDLRTYDEEILKGIITWISNCKSLKQLSFRHVVNALPIVAEVLKSPGIRLTRLYMVDFGSEDEADDHAEDLAAWTALGSQDLIDDLTLGLQSGLIDDFRIHEIPTLVDSICQLKNLRTLNLTQAHITAAEVQRFAKALPKLFDFSFNGEMVGDAVLEHLSNLPQLTALSITNLSAFTYDGLFRFCDKLNDQGNRGLRMDILNQLGKAKQLEPQVMRLQAYFRKTINGQITIAFYNDPDELHEGDFSDDSD
ncbi:RNI-like protein [Hypoxylon sp. EC38]|nr:RNI-like protein [Hypoxylon sp. EC38]